MQLGQRVSRTSRCIQCPHPNGITEGSTPSLWCPCIGLIVPNPLIPFSTTLSGESVVDLLGNDAFELNSCLVVYKLVCWDSVGAVQAGGLMWLFDALHLLLAVITGLVG